MSLDAIPVELRERPQWVTWKAEVRDGKPTKVPYRADGAGRASSTDPATWATFTAARVAADWLGMDGVGYVFAADDPYTGVDLDAALPAADRAAIIAALNSYSETSVSGAGAHVIVRAALATGRHPAGLGVFDRGRYFVVTGAHIPGTPATVEERQAKLEEVLARYLPAPPTESPRPVEPDDRELLDRALAARNGADLERLYHGDTSGYASASEADLALCRIAAFWTGRDPARIDAWLRSSRLYRRKWERTDYRERTIAAAIASTTDVYTPQRPPSASPPAPAAGNRRPGPEPAPAAPAERPWRSVTWATFRDEAPPAHSWLVDGLLPAGMLCFVAGPPKRGKTWLGIGLALALALGATFADHRTPEPRHVLYAALEGSRTGLRTRIGALARGHGADPDGQDLERLHLLYRPRPFDLAELASADWLLQEADDTDAALIIVDVLRAAARFQENAAEDFARIRDHLEPLLAAGRTVALLHHFGKLNETQKERSPGERMAGTGAMYGALDVGLLITRSDDGARRLGVTVEARDFAAPDELQLAIDGAGSGEHGGFAYTDTATLIVDPDPPDEVDLAAEIEELLADGKWRTVGEIAQRAKGGIGRNKDEVKTTLEQHAEATGEQDARFATLEDGRLVGRHKTAQPWGTITMREKVARPLSQPEPPAFEGASPELGGSPPRGGEPPAEPPSSGGWLGAEPPAS
jgi:hypothetical protein